MKSAKANKRVRVLYAGGLEISDGFSPAVAQQTLTEYLELQLVAEVSVTIIDNVTGTTTRPGLAVDIGKDIVEHYGDYDGFVIVHPLENVLPVANLLRFMLRNISKPIVFTGNIMNDKFQDIPPELAIGIQNYKQINLRTSLVSAVQLAAVDCVGVMMAYDSRVVRAVRAVEAPIIDGQLFYSFREIEVARIQFGIQMYQVVPKGTGEPIVLSPEYSNRIYTATLEHNHTFPDDINEAYDVVVLKNVTGEPDSQVLQGIVLPIIAHSRLPWLTEQPNLICIPNITFDALVAKLMKIYAEPQPDISILERTLHTNMVNELG